MTLKKKAQHLEGFNVSVDQLFALDDDDSALQPSQLPTQRPKAQPLPVPPSQKAEPMPVMPSSSHSQPLPVQPGEVQSRTDKNETMLYEVEEEGEPETLTFVLPLVPGSDDQDDIEEPAEFEVDEDDEITVDDDPWSWSVSNFPEWLSKMMTVGVPRHSGRDTTGIERVIAHFEALDKEISRAVRSDKNGELDIGKIEQARDELYNALVRLKDRLAKIENSKYPKKKNQTKKKKKSDMENDLVKEAKAAHVGNIVVTAPLIVSIVARTCINSMVSAGKDIEDTFDSLTKKFDFTPREEAETMQLLADMGYPMRRPRGYFRDEEIDYTSPDLYDWAQNFPG